MQADVGDPRVAEAGEHRAGLVDREPGGATGVGVDGRAQRRVQHGGRILGVHLLGDDVVAHQVFGTGQLVTGQPHQRAEVLAPVADEVMWGIRPGRVENVGPAGVGLDELVETLRLEPGNRRFVPVPEGLVRPRISTVSLVTLCGVLVTPPCDDCFTTASCRRGRFLASVARGSPASGGNRQEGYLAQQQGGRGGWPRDRAGRAGPAEPPTPRRGIAPTPDGVGVGPRSRRLGRSGRPGAGGPGPGPGLP